MIVHFIGKAGTGKSTLMASVAADSGYATPPDGLGRMLSLADWMLPVAMPLAWPVGRRLVAHNRKGEKGPKAQGWTTSIAMQMARRWVVPREQIHLVDHAMTNQLRKHANATASALLDALPLPEMVVNVTAPHALTVARVVLRDKPGQLLGRPLSGETALETGRALARRWLAMLGADETLRCLRAWSRWKCSPELRDQQIVSLLVDAQRMPLTEKDVTAIQADPLPQKWRWLHDGYVERGVQWLNIVNDGREPPDVHARQIVDAIRRHASAMSVSAH